MKEKEKHNRRKFLSLGFLTGAAMLAPVVTRAESQEKNLDEEEMVMLLTPDGKLVKVKKSIVGKAKSGNKVSNQEILEWAKQPKKTS